MSVLAKPSVQGVCNKNLQTCLSSNKTTITFFLSIKCLTFTAVKHLLVYCVGVFIKRCHSVRTFVHLRYMKTQHIQFEILNERLSVFKCNLIQLNFVQNILVIGRICDANFHPFYDIRDDVTRSLDVCHR